MCQVLFGFAMCWVLPNVPLYVEYYKVFPCVGSSKTFARVSSSLWFCRVLVLGKPSLVCQAQIVDPVYQL